MWGLIAAFAMRILPAIPQLVGAVETVFSNKPKSGAAKWIAVEQALSQPIQEVAADLAKLAPAGTDANKVTDAIARYTKAINDATVAVAHDLGIFDHSS